MPPFLCDPPIRTARTSRTQSLKLSLRPRSLVAPNPADFELHEAAVYLASTRRIVCKRALNMRGVPLGPRRFSRAPGFGLAGFGGWSHAAARIAVRLVTIELIPPSRP